MNRSKPIVTWGAVAILVSGIAAALVSAHGLDSAHGPIASVTGAPSLGGLDAEADCTLCHQDFENPCAPDPCNLNTPGGAVEILDLPEEGYVPGIAISLRVRLRTDSTLASPARRWGFQLVAVSEGSGQGTGTWVLDPDTLDVVTGSDPYASRQYLVHQYEGTRPGLAGPIEWTMAWMPPESNEGNIIFCAAGNATNGNEEPGLGDFVFTSRETLPPSIVPVRPVSWGSLKSRYR